MTRTSQVGYDQASCDIKRDLKEWKIYFCILGDIVVNRYFKSLNIKAAKEATLNCFSDASEEVYCQVYSHWWILILTSIVPL